MEVEFWFLTGSIAARTRMYRMNDGNNDGVDGVGGVGVTRSEAATGTVEEIMEPDHVIDIFTKIDN